MTEQELSALRQALDNQYPPRRTVTEHLRDYAPLYVLGAWLLWFLYLAAS